MISKAQRGRDVAGLVRYLFGPGRANEHTNQRIVASSDPTWTGTTQPDRQTMRQLIDELHDPVRRHGDGTKDGYVYHIAISLSADDRPLTHAQWRHVAERFAGNLSLDKQVTWMAMNHGLSANGNDHIHLVVNLIRDDTGRAHPLPYDRLRRREACIELEDELGLTATAPAGQGQPISLSRREVEAVRDDQVVDATDLNQHRIATIVRAVATGARSEQEFVERLRGEGLIVRARHARENRNTITGYSVAAKSGTRNAEPLVWYGGGRLGKDLRLPALRARWRQTDEQRDAAAPTWHTVAQRLPKAEPVNLAAAAEAMQQAHTRLESIAPDDDLAWQHAATASAGVIAAAASTTTDERHRRELIKACHALEHSGQSTVTHHTGAADHDTRRRPVPGPPSLAPSGSGNRAQRPAIVWPARPASTTANTDSATREFSRLMSGAARVLIAARHTDTPGRTAVQALLVQAAELALHIARARAAGQQAAAAQHRAVIATERALSALSAASLPAGWRFTRSGAQTLHDAREARRHAEINNLDHAAGQPLPSPSMTPATEPPDLAR